MMDNTLAAKKQQPGGGWDGCIDGKPRLRKCVEQENTERGHEEGHGHGNFALMFALRVAHFFVFNFQKKKKI